MHCCEFFADVMDRVLGETDNFVIAPTLGPIEIPGYVLGISKEHYCGTGEFPDDVRREFASLCEEVDRVLNEQYGLPTLLFEHGPRICGFRGGGCIDHAHTHHVPSVDILDVVSADVVRRIPLNAAVTTTRHPTVEEVLKRTADIADRRMSSYAFAAYEDFQLSYEVNFVLPSQHLRRVVAKTHGTDAWNWRVHPGRELMERTYDALHGKFFR